MTIKKIAESVKKELAAAGIDTAQRESRFLVEGICRLSRGRMFLHSDMILTDAEREQVALAVKKRLEGWPLQYLIGEWDFYGYPIYVGEGVLIPRPETELLVRDALRALSALNKKSPAVADLCSGSGCIAIAIAREYADARVTAVEKYDDAYGYLERNIERNEASNVLPVKDDVLGPLAGSLEGMFDVIVCNPPYIRTEDLATLQKEVQFEPVEALDGKEDGLYFYREITKLWKPCLAPGGTMLFEIGFDQGESVSQILRENGFSWVEVRRDYNELDRIVCATIN